MGLYEILHNWFNGVYFHEIPNLIISGFNLITGSTPVIKEDHSDQFQFTWIYSKWTDYVTKHFTPFEYGILLYFSSLLACFTIISCGVSLINRDLVDKNSHHNSNESANDENDHENDNDNDNENDNEGSDWSDEDSGGSDEDSRWSDEDSGGSDEDSGGSYEDSGGSDEDSGGSYEDSGGSDITDGDIYNFINNIDEYYSEMSDVVE
jgi:hypothetical protein